MNEDVRAFKYALEKPKHTKEHIKKDSIRYFVEKLENYELKPKFKLQTFQCVEFSIDTINICMSKTHDCECNLSPMILIDNQ